MDAPSILERMDEEGKIDLPAPEAGTKRKRIAKLSKAPNVVSLPDNPQLLKDLYSSFHVLHCKSSSKREGIDKFNWKNVQTLYGDMRKDKDSWCIETKGDSERQPTPLDFLQPTTTSDRGYCSFLLQKDTELLKDTMKQLPVDKVCPEWSHGECIWFFFGRNSTGNKELPGRAEHTDSVSHDGTWHFQLSGSKRWFLRPTTALLEQVGEELLDAKQVLQVDCHAGDILVVNTRLWWHRTELCVQDMPSVSYARDFYFESPQQENGESKEDEAASSGMTNVDGMYAANDIEEGTIVFREEDVPDCEMHRSKDPNCEVVLLDDESYAVVSIKSIAAGEFFCTAESDDEDDEVDVEDSDGEQWHSP